MKTASYTELKNNLKSYLNGVIDNNEPLIIHRSGNQSLVVIPLEEYNAIKETEYLMHSPAMMQHLQSAENHLKEGKGREYSLDELKEKMALRYHYTR
ncbi:MAG: type II toxin-antitoxin system prevent-host-death family antitoxin [Dysgonamonadaceae bacterium]|jgi:antitoxin YefM|nr:type II toxin-antitoxin system prevent-host-death family antitoxin [Dysgonamonadaceae bacterium]